MKKTIKKLSLHKRTISNLKAGQMNIVGGDPSNNFCETKKGCSGNTIYDCSCNYTCLNTCGHDFTCKGHTCHGNCI